MNIAVGGSAANPPHHGHLSLIQQLMICNLFDVIIWIPSGERYDKVIDVHPDHRVAMTELFLPKMWRVRTNPNLVVKYDSVYGQGWSSYEYLLKIQKEYKKYDENLKVFWYTGSDTDVKFWINGPFMLENNMFLFIPREGYPLKYENKEIDYEFEELPNINSSEIRQMVKDGKSIDHLVDPYVAEYIHINKLYIEN